MPGKSGLQDRQHATVIHAHTQVATQNPFVSRSLKRREDHQTSVCDNTQFVVAPSNFHVQPSDDAKTARKYVRAWI